MEGGQGPAVRGQAAGAERQSGTGWGFAARFLPLAVVLLALAIGYALGAHRYLSMDALREYREALSAFVDENAAFAILAYVGIYIAAVALSFPGASVLTAAGGLMFGYGIGTALALFSATVGATCIFLIARTSLGAILTMRAGSRLQRLRRGFQEEGFAYLLFLRLVPFFPFWLVNLAAALFGLRLMPYVAATAIGILPGTSVLAYFGHGLGMAVGGEMPDYWLQALALRIALLALAIVTFLAIRKWRLRHSGGQGLRP